MNNLFTIISAIAAANPAGFTYNVETNQMQASGYAVALACTQDSHGIDGLESVINIESTTGILDWDGEYDTDIVQYLSECDDNEIDMIFQAYLDDEYMDDELKDYVCTQKGLHRIHRIEFFDTHAHVECQDGMIQYDWDGRHDVDEDEAAEWMEAHDIDPLSIKEHADEFEDNYYTV